MLTVQHRYQWTIVLTFSIWLGLFAVGYTLAHQYQWPGEWQWILFTPTMLLISALCLWQRTKISERGQHRSHPLHLINWLILGLGLVAREVLDPIPWRFASLDFSFIVFSLFLADSVWDFQRRR